MNKQTKPRQRKAWKVVSLICTSLLMACVVAITTFLILDSTEVVSITSGVNRQYMMTFIVEDDVYATKVLYRGSPIDYSDIKDPVKDGNFFTYYTFSGWDLTGDGFVDILPSRAYKSYKAVAVFKEHKI